MDIKTNPTTDIDGFIALLDSGCGGVTVLSELLKLMPYESYLFFGDIANAPYGDRSTEEVRAITLKNAAALRQRGAKAFVIACNTATGAAAKELREIADIPVIGVEPAIKPAVTALPGKHILVMATPLTLKQEKFEILYNNWHTMADVEPLPCPGLASLIEAGHTDDDDVQSYLEELFEPHRGSGIDGVVLGCTHYPLIRKTIARLLPGAEIFDGGEGTARQTKKRLEESGLLNPAGRGAVRIETSGTPEENTDFAFRVMKLTEMLLPDDMKNSQ